MTTAGKVTGVVYADKDGKLQEQKARTSPSPVTRSKARGCCSPESSKFRTARHLSGQVGRNHAPHHRLGLAASSTSWCTCTAARRYRHHPRRCATTRAASSAATSSRRCRSACRSWRYLESLAHGFLHHRAGPLRPAAGMWIVERIRGGKPRHCTEEKDEHHADRRRAFRDDHANDTAMRDHALVVGAAVYDAVARRAPSRRRCPILDPGPGTNRMSEKPEDGVEQARPGARHRNQVLCRMAASSTTAALRT